MSPKKLDLDIDEQSPLLRADHSDDGLVVEDSFVESKSSWYLFLLTLGIGGLQIVWSVELSNGSPYLLSLGMSKALVAVVWLAGPLTGVLVQPYIGIVSDRCRTSWGRRKPFMIGGTIGTVVSSLLLAYARQIVHFIGGWSAEELYEGYWMGFTIAFATVMMWCLDFSINTVQAAIRAFIVDGAPAHQQESANAWASRLTGIGNVLGYIFGYLNLPKYFRFLGDEQFKILCTLASIFLSVTILISILTIKERNPQDDPPSQTDHQSLGVIAFFKSIMNSIKKLPTPIRSVCEIQFFQWIGWFPFLFYITTYVGQLYVNPLVSPDMSNDEVDKLWGKATRMGTLALLVEAVVCLAANIFLPFIIESSYKAVTSDDDSGIERRSISTPPTGARHRSASSGNIASGRQTSDHTKLDGDMVERGPQPRPSFFARCLPRLEIPGLTLRRAWLLAQLLFSACMFSTFFISTPLSATIMVAIVGLSWSLTLWAPFALISAEISQRDQSRRQRNRQQSIISSAGSPGIEDESGDENEDQAGVLLGLHNVAISAPQVIATLISSAVFKALQKPRNIPGDVSVAWTLRIGGVAALVAAFFTWRMEETGVNKRSET